jgi:cytidyltransferase-like protein
MRGKIIAVSGYMDPVHIGHLRMILEAGQMKGPDDQLIIFLNTDDAAIRKKGKVFMPFVERAELLSGFSGVDRVIPASDADGTVCESIKMFMKAGDIFCNGGDRLPENTPELKLCCDLGIQVKFNVGGEKIQSSSELVKKAHGVQTA